jgi:hypothetical protein
MNLQRGHLDAHHPAPGARVSTTANRADETGGAANGVMCVMHEDGNSNVHLIYCPLFVYKMYRMLELRKHEKHYMSM